MVVYFEHLDPVLLPLLFARSTLGIRSGRDVPEKLAPSPDSWLVPTSGGSRQTPQADDWDAHWLTRLDELATQRHPGEVVAAPDLHEALRKDRLLRRPRWRDVHGDSFDAAAYERWLAAIDEATDLTVGPAISRALIDAWHAGLFAVTILPIATPFASRVSPSCLVVSAATWRDVPSMHFALALDAATG
ncbi:hypothetical protein [Frondihabitans cladoniiphilus]